MTASLGRITARLAELDEALPVELIQLINQNIKPPEPISADDVHIRAMYIVSDQVNSFGGRFSPDDHERLAGLLIDSPVLVGHRKDMLPIGRTFHAVAVEHDGRPWVKSYFYWLKSTDQSATLKDNLDGGIYKECSIAFAFGLPECSVCGKDIRRCEHAPFEVYAKDDEAHSCYFNYRQLERVLETSLVYRGAVPATSVSKDLSGSDTLTMPDSRAAIRSITPITDFEQLDSDRPYLVVPKYDGLPITARVEEQQLLIAHLDGQPLESKAFENYQPQSFRPTDSLFGLLVGYRGRARCRLGDLQKYLADKSGPVTRLVLNVYPHQGLVSLPRSWDRAKLNIRMMPYRIVTTTDLDRQAREIMTNAGVEICALPSTGRFLSDKTVVSYHYQPPVLASDTGAGYSLTMNESTQVATLTLRLSASKRSQRENNTRQFELNGFDLEQLQQGRRFVASSLSVTPKQTAMTNTKAVARGELVNMNTIGDALVLDCDGLLSGRLVMRPVRLNQQNRYLFYRLSDEQNQKEKIGE